MTRIYLPRKLYESFLVGINFEFNTGVFFPVLPFMAFLTEEREIFWERISAL